MWPEYVLYAWGVGVGAGVADSGRQGDLAAVCLLLRLVLLIVLGGHQRPQAQAVNWREKVSSCFIAFIITYFLF